MALYIDIFLKLLLSVILGGIVGYEREHKSRPAGLRTHVLVCIGAALVQITSFNFYNQYRGIINIDPMRLGAQVISGIGFLGAGTILKEGASIKGLTTAASIWAIACIGLAVGTGLYAEATIATLFIMIALRGMKKIEEYMARGKRDINMEILADNVPGMLGQIGNSLGFLDIHILNVEIENSETGDVLITLLLKLTHNLKNETIMDKIMSLPGIKEIRFLS